MSFIQVVHNRYDKSVVKLVRRFGKLDFKHRKTALDLQFLKTCQDFKVTPKFLQFRVANGSLRQSQTYQTCKNWLLLEKIRVKKKNLKTLVRELATVKEELLHTLSFLDFNHVFNLIVSSNEKSILKCRHVQQKKLRNLTPGYKPETSLDSHDPERVIVNFSSHILSDSKKSLLCKGLRFALPPKEIDYADFLVQFELLYRDTLEFNLPSENFDFLKNKLKDICFSTLNPYNFDKVNTNLTASDGKSLKELIQRKDLVIQKADKGNTVVITNRENYLKVTKSLISDNSKFIPLNVDKRNLEIVNLEIKGTFQNLRE